MTTVSAAANFDSDEVSPGISSTDAITNRTRRMGVRASDARVSAPGRTPCARLLSSSFALVSSLAALALFVSTAPTAVRAEVDAAHRASGRSGPRLGRSGPAFLDGGFDASDVVWDDDGVDAFLRAAARSRARQKALTEDQERRRYLSAESLASYLGIQSVRAVHVPVPVNLILVGFDGDGHMGLRLDHTDLVAWLEHADHVRHHARLPSSVDSRVGGSSRSDDDDDNAKRHPHELHAEPVHAEHLHDAPTHSVARFNFTCHIVDVGSKVLETLERAQRIHARPMRPTLPGLDESQFR